jgi:hypothetical protein
MLGFKSGNGISERRFSWKIMAADASRHGGMRIWIEWDIQIASIHSSKGNVKK